MILVHNMKVTLERIKVKKRGTKKVYDILSVKQNGYIYIEEIVV